MTDTDLVMHAQDETSAFFEQNGHQIGGLRQGSRPSSENCSGIVFLSRTKGTNAGIAL